MILSGLDEAALGPKLGPFCAALAEFELDEAVTPDPDLYEILADSVSGTADGTGRLRVNDSKVLYSPARGIAALEYPLLAFLSASGLEFPMSLKELISALCPPQDRSALDSTPWFAGSKDLLLPFCPKSLNSKSHLGTTLKSQGSTLSDTLADKGVSIRPPRARFVTAGAFNRALDEGRGKAGGVRNLLTPLLETALKPSGNCTPSGPRDGDASGIGGKKQPQSNRRITVDRQGGRRYYGEWLIEILPGAPLRTIEEGPKRSVYTFGGTSIEFTVGADGFRLETALSSMLAKYLREAAMTLFNRWWAARVPGLRGTAGYPADAKRFIADLDRADAIPEDRDLLIRRL